MYRSDSRIFLSSTNIPVDNDRLKINVKDGAITSAAIRDIFAGILSVPVLLDTLKYLSVVKTFSTGIDMQASKNFIAKSLGIYFMVRHISLNTYVERLRRLYMSRETICVLP